MHKWKDIRARGRTPEELSRLDAQVKTELRELDERIRANEAKAGIDSGTLRREVSEGKRQETWDVCRWLMLLNERDRLARRPA